MTGASGFIGGHLSEELERAGHQVLPVDLVPAFDDEDTFTSGTLFMDVSVPGVLSRAVYSYKPDAIVHLAAQVGREFGEDDIARTIRWNAVGSAMVAQAAAKLDGPILYTSTSEVYGDIGTMVANEAGPFAIPHNLYGLSKRWGEEVFRLYSPDRLKIARLSMPYGPGAPPGRGRRAMDNFLWQAHHRMPITVHRGAERSWCWVGDTVRALRLILESTRMGTWNVGRDDDPRTMMELAEIACDMTDASRHLIEVVEPPGMQTVVKRLSTEKLMTQFDWEPTVDLEEGMERVYEWVQRFDAGGVWVG